MVISFNGRENQSIWRKAQTRPNSYKILLWISYSYSKIVQSECCMKWMWHSDWMFFEYECKTCTWKFYDCKIWYKSLAKIFTWICIKFTLTKGDYQTQLYYMKTWPKEVIKHTRSPGEVKLDSDKWKLWKNLFE